MQHYNADVLIELDGDTARLRTNHMAVHLHHGDEPIAHFDAGLVHRFEVRWLTGTPSHEVNAR